MLIVQKTIFDPFFKLKQKLSKKIHTNPHCLDLAVITFRTTLAGIGRSEIIQTPNKDFWMPKAPGNSNDSDIAHNNPPRSDLNSSQQWFMEGAEAELFPNKKQAVEVPHPNSYTALLNSNISSWGNSSSFHSQFTERLFDDETSSISYSGIRKVKVNQVKESEGFVSVSLGHTYSTGDNINNTINDHAYSKADDESITMGLSFDRGNDSMISMADTFNRGDNSFMSMGEPYSCPSASKDNSNITTMTQSFIKEDDNNIAMVAFNEHSNALLMDQVFNKDDTMSKTDSSGLSMRHSFSKVENNIISFGGLSDDADNMNSSGRLVCNYDFLMGQPSVQRLEEHGFSESTSDALVSGVQVDTILRKKDQKGNKKAPPNNFPSNVRSLLSTGMLDGVAVKYIAWSREELRGVIKGAAYLCGCQSCTFSKAINAYEFERHAGCKTKHPNNHIYFENGKTIYGVVQELRNTPQSVLFDVIQTITGSPINQKSFRLWKESFLAATRELQRIYGKEEGKIVS
ncbi:uncharacterized protein LOC111914928 isoform X2 [Lactuca sativa]|uniref:uncharacterized protein LOC111914928 isoform X2 n=1 Tax=Lactuca sativa TaxID=4236 RepID=UPI000CD87A41|nr:uncharacterized protein LOC111914928 isoform X2 [Lactuca sativa]